MFDTVAQIALAVALILPGFLVVQLSERRRPANPTGGDLELVLRGLVYALAIQSIAGLVGWLPNVIDDARRWDHHVDALSVYGLTVCVIAPTLVGLGLGRLLREAEADGSLKWWHYALGGRDARRAWDFTFSRHNGAWMRVYVLSPQQGQPAVLLGKYGTSSWAAQAPAQPDLYLQEVWPADADGQVAEDAFARGSVGAMWINGDQIARIEILVAD